MPEQSLWNIVAGSCCRTFAANDKYALILLRAHKLNATLGKLYLTLLAGQAGC